MNNKCRIRISRQDFNIVTTHLFPGDLDEHGAVLLAGLSSTESQPTLYVREVHLAKEGIDYVQGKIGYRALAPTFIHRLITRARNERLVYLAVHNHASDLEVGFSRIDLESHERGYPALLQIAKGMPVGGLVFGRRSIQADLWLPSGQRLLLDEAVIVGNTIQRLSPGRRNNTFNSPVHDRQVRMFGQSGQAELKKCHVGIVGLGGIGSLVAEFLARLGVGRFSLIDNDRVEQSNLSRIVGASRKDAEEIVPKVIVSQRLINQANEVAQVQTIMADVAKESVAKHLLSCDYIFLAADSMRARLVVNAIVHQYLIPAVQLGSKIRCDPAVGIIDIMSANRRLRPGLGCLLCNQLIDATQLAKESKTDEERKAQAYGVEEPNPSVISLNAVAAAHCVNDFLLDYLSLRPEASQLYYEHFHFLKDARALVAPRNDLSCSECSHTGLRYGRGDAIQLPCLEG
jgi:molybdopterin/thiamine biosynthesis adenylyltransferase